MFSFSSDLQHQQDIFTRYFPTDKTIHRQSEDITFISLHEVNVQGVCFSVNTNKWKNQSLWQERNDLLNINKDWICCHWENFTANIRKNGFIQACNPVWTPAFSSQPLSSPPSWSPPGWRTRDQSELQKDLHTHTNKTWIHNSDGKIHEGVYGLSLTCFCADVPQISSIKSIRQLHNGLKVWNTGRKRSEESDTTSAAVTLLWRKEVLLGFCVE